MNTVLKGNEFEQNCYNLIKNAIENDEFGISPKNSKLFLKKKYFSSLRNRDITFDLSIEVWLPDAQRYSILCLIECKDYTNKKVPVDDVEEFILKINQIAGLGHCVKGIVISNNSFQSGSIEIAERAGLMLIEVTNDNKLAIKLHKGKRFSIKTDDIDKKIENLLLNALGLNNISGLKKLNRKQIEEIANNLHNKIDEKTLGLSLGFQLQKTVAFFKEKHNLNFEFEKLISENSAKNIFGYFDVTNNIICIDSSIVNTKRFAFLFAHEIGHFILHRKLQINQQFYDMFEDAEYDFLSDRHLLKNDKHWIEWQANEFASAFIMPADSFIRKLIEVQTDLGINKVKVGHIYLDDQPINRDDFIKITAYLTTHFNTTYESVKYRLQSLNLITYNRKEDSYNLLIRKIRSFYSNFKK